MRSKLFSLLFDKQTDTVILCDSNGNAVTQQDYTEFLNESIGEVTTTYSYKYSFVPIYIQEAINNVTYCDVDIFARYMKAYERDSLELIGNAQEQGEIDIDTANLVSTKFDKPLEVLKILSEAPEPVRLAYNIYVDGTQDDKRTAFLKLYAILHSKFTYGHKLKKCFQCGRYFMTQSRIDEKHCSKECKRKTKTQNQLKNQSEPLVKLYRRIGNRLLQRIDREPDISRQLELLNERDKFMDGYKALSNDSDREAYLDEWDKKTRRKK